MKRLLVCGSRKWTDERAIGLLICALRNELEVVIEGEADGADSMARKMAERYRVPVLPFQADWRTHAPGWCNCRRVQGYCPAAGPRRNWQMLEEGRPTHVVAFTDDFRLRRSGTRNMCQIAFTAGLPVTLVCHVDGICYSYDISLDTTTGLAVQDGKRWPLAFVDWHIE